MKPSNYLHQLVKSMSSAEKRYFSLRMKQFTDKTAGNYLILFRAMDKLQDYDELLLRKKLGDSKLLKHLPAAKHQLYKVLLRNMSEFRAAKSRRIQLSEMIQDVRTLHLRGLNEQALQLLQTAKRFAEEHEEYVQILELLDLERTLVFNSPSKTAAHDPAELVEQEQRVYASIGDLTAYNILYKRLVALRKRGSVAAKPEDKAQLQEILQSPLLQSPKQSLPLRAQMNFHRTKAGAALMTMNTDATIFHYRMLMSLWENLPHIDEYDSADYHNDIINYLNIGVHYGNPFEIEGFIRKAKEIKVSASADKLRSFQNLTNIELLYCLKTADFQRGKQLGNDVLEGLEKFDEQLSIARKMTLCLNMAFIHFFSGDSSGALTWTERILTMRPVDIRSDIHAKARMFLPVIQYELGNLDILDGVLTSTRRYFNKHDLDWQHAKAVMRTLATVINLPGSEQNAHFRKLQLLLQDLRANSGAALLPGIFELQIWAEARADGQTLPALYASIVKTAMRAANLNAADGLRDSETEDSEPRSGGANKIPQKS